MLSSAGYAHLQNKITAQVCHIRPVLSICWGTNGGSTWALLLYFGTHCGGRVVFSGRLHLRKHQKMGFDHVCDAGHGALSEGERTQHRADPNMLRPCRLRGDSCTYGRTAACKLPKQVSTLARLHMCVQSLQCCSTLSTRGVTPLVCLSWQGKLLPKVQMRTPAAAMPDSWCSRIYVASVARIQSTWVSNLVP